MKPGFHPSCTDPTNKIFNIQISWRKKTQLIISLSSFSTPPCIPCIHGLIRPLAVVSWWMFPGYKSNLHYGAHIHKQASRCALAACINRRINGQIQDKEHTDWADHAISQLSEDPHEAHLQGETLTERTFQTSTSSSCYRSIVNSIVLTIFTLI